MSLGGIHPTSPNDSDDEIHDLVIPSEFGFGIPRCVEIAYDRIISFGFHHNEGYLLPAVEIVNFNLDPRFGIDQQLQIGAIYARYI